jgi:hypothetical protein
MITVASPILTITAETMGIHMSNTMVQVPLSLPHIETIQFNF